MVDGLEARVLMSAGQLDPTFAGTGKELLPLPGGSSAYVVTADATQADGKVLLLESSPQAGARSPFCIQRLNVNGSTDPSFGSNGIVTSTFDGDAISILVQPDGRIVVGGAVGNRTVGGGGVDGPSFLARFNANGSPDATFGNGGTLAIQVPGQTGFDAVALAPGGKLVEVGHAPSMTPSGPNAAQVFYAARYGADGSLDASFNGTGYVYHQLQQDVFPGPYETLAVAVQPDGKVLVGSGLKDAFAVWRYTAAGSLDLTFGEGGLATTSFEFASFNDDDYSWVSVSNIIVQPNGQILVAGTENVVDGEAVTWAMSRYNANGTLDTGFGNEGLVTLPGGFFGGSNSDPNLPGGFALLPDGRIVIGGVKTPSDSPPPNTDRGAFIVYRYLANGLADPTFQSAPVQFFGDTFGQVGATTVEPDGSVVIAGTVADGTTNLFPTPSNIGVARVQGGNNSFPSPFLGHSFNVNTDTIFADDFDNGGEGVSYHDTTPANIGGQYRNTAVDITSGGANGYSVGYVVAGEWLDYTINVPTTGTYRFQASVACLNPGGTFHAAIDGQNVSGAMKVPNTGGWEAWQTVTSANTFTLAAGTHVLRVAFDSGGYYGPGCVGDFNDFQFAPASTPISPPPTTTYTWTNGPNAPMALAEAMTAAVNNQMYVFDGYNVIAPLFEATTACEAYDPVANAWHSIAPMPEPITHAGCATDGTRYVYLAGGYFSNHSTGYQTFAINNVWRYDAMLDQWTAMPALPAPRGAGALVLLDGTLHFFGGVDVNRADKADQWTLNLADPNAAWQAAPALPSVRNHMGATVLNGRIYAIGGQVGDNDNNPIATALVFDPATNQWSSIASLPTPRSHIAADTFVVGNRIFVVGGEAAGGNPTDQVTAYDPATNTWTQLPKLPGPRHSAAARYVNGQLVVATGWDYTAEKQTWLSTPIA